MTGDPLERVVGRVLVCVRCRRTVDVLEAAAGARNDDEHRWINPSSYVCGCCLEAAGEIVTGALSAAAVAAGRARTAQQRHLQRPRGGLVNGESGSGS